MYTEHRQGRRAFIAAVARLFDGAWHSVAVTRSPLTPALTWTVKSDARRARAAADGAAAGAAQSLEDVRVYVDGEVAAVGVMDGDASGVVATNVAVGCLPPRCGDAERFPGEVDAVKLFAAELSAEQVAAHAVCCDCLGLDRGCGFATPPPPAGPAGAAGGPHRGASSVDFGEAEVDERSGWVPPWAAALLACAPRSLLVLLQVARKGVAWGSTVDFLASRRESSTGWRARRGGTLGSGGRRRRGSARR